MEKKLKTTRVLVLNASLIILFAIVMVGANIILTNHVNNNLKKIDDTREKKLNLILNMSQIARERSAIMLRMYVEEDTWKIDNDFFRFHKLAIKFISYRKQFQKTGLTTAEESIFKNALSLIKITEPLQNGIVERIHSGQKELVHSDIAKKDIPLEIELLGMFDGLAQLVVANSYQQRVLAKDEFTRALILVALISVAILIIIVLLTSRSLKKIQTIELGLILEAENQSWDATHDPLTNIYNRRWLKHKVVIIYQQETDKADFHSLIYMDLDDFKLINDQFGHVAGDHYLQQFCRKVEKCIRQNDTFSRMGGDEFAILLENCNIDTANKIANEVLTTTSRLSVEYNGQKLSTGCSIGVYQFSSGKITFDELIHRADSLCYNAKKEGKNRITSEVASPT